MRSFSSVRETVTSCFAFRAEPMAANRWELSGAIVCSSSSFRVRIKAVFSSDKEVKRTAKECNVTADRFTAGKTGNGLVDNCLENGSGKVFLGCTVVDQRLDICLCEIHRSVLRWDKAPCNVLAYSFSPVASVWSRDAIWSMKEPVPPAQIPFIRCSTLPPSK